MALFVLEKCLWPAKTRKNLNFLGCLHVFDLVLKYCSDIDNGNWLQLHSYFILLMGFFALVSGMSFFLSVFQFVGWSYLVLHFLRKRLQLDSKIHWITNGLFLGFFLGRWLSSLASYLYGLKPAWIAETCFFLWHQVFSIITLGGYLGLFFKCACFF